MFINVDRLMKIFFSDYDAGTNHLHASVGFECTYANQSDVGNCFNKCCLHHLHNSGKWLYILELCIDFGTRKTEVLNSLIINITAKANDTTDILQTFR